MKRFFLPLLISAAAILAFASCDPEKKDEHTTPEVPTSVDANFTSLVKGDIVSGDINTFPVSASADGATLNLTFYSDKVYLPAGSYSVGQAAGNFIGHFKNDKVDCDIKSGSIAVTADEEDNYTFVGTLRLDNEAGTVLKLNAAGSLVYALPTEYYYTYESNVTVNGITANVYKIYDLEYHQLAEASVVGDENGTFEVNGTGEKGSAVYGNVNNGSWMWVDGFGTDILLHGKVTVANSHGKKNFSFQDIHSRDFKNCELKSSVTPVLDPAPADVKFIWGWFLMESVASPILKDMYETTIKLFYRESDDSIGREFLSFVIVGNEKDPGPSHQGDGQPCALVGYDTYSTYSEANAAEYAAVKGRIVPEATCFYVVDGKRVPVPKEEGWFALINYKEKGDQKAGLAIFLNASYAVPAALMDALDPSGGVYSAMGSLIE